MIAGLDLAFLTELCRVRAGLRLDAARAYLIESRLAPVARREGFGSAEELLAVLRERADERLGWAAVEAMALPEGEFFRDRAMFDHLATQVLPAMARSRGSAPVRVWCAACGTGQEPYSLAMIIDETPGLAGRVELFASDLSERSLEKAQAGLYSQFEVQRGLPARTLVQHFERDGDAFALSPRVRQMVRWRRMNLLNATPGAGPFEVILCRNLLPAMTVEARSAILEGLTRDLAPGGRLVLGRSEPPPSGFVTVAPGIHAPVVGSASRAVA